jgi:lysophospholipase L1-like esterase
VYQTAYPSFFESYTTQCDDVTFNPYVDAGSYITQDLRSSLNQLGQELNTLLAYFIANANQQLRIGRSPHTTAPHIADFIVFSDQGERFAGHRMCRDGVMEPDINNPDTWFFNFGSNADTVIASGETNPLGPASDYTVVDPNSCNSTDDIGSQLSCAISDLVTSGTIPGDEQVPAYAYPESLAKSFHPTRIGHDAVSAELQQRLSYASAISPGEGCPSVQGLDLRIVGIGDSITWGYQSSDGQGYFTTLDSNLGTVAAGCTPNTYEFVGSQISGAFRDEGYPGLTVSEIQMKVESSGTLKQRPNLILLMAGTNDMNQGADPIATVASLSSFIDYLFEQCPDAVILVQHIPAIGTGQFTSTISATQINVIKYNAGISAMVDTKIAQGRHISRVHQRTTILDHYPGDTLHPNDLGYSILGEAWTERIWVVAQNGWITHPVAGSHPKTQCASGLWWDPQGQIANGAGLGANLYDGIDCLPV